MGFSQPTANMTTNGERVVFRLKSTLTSKAFLKWLYNKVMVTVEEEGN